MGNIKSIFDELDQMYEYYLKQGKILDEQKAPFDEWNRNRKKGLHVQSLIKARSAKRKAKKKPQTGFVPEDIGV